MALTKVSNRMISGAVANILDYGADPTGVSDSTTAIQTALDDNLVIYVPTGTYLVSTINIPHANNVRIFGDGMALSILKGNTASVPVISQAITSVNGNYGEISELKIDASVGADGINLTDTGARMAEWVFSNLQIVGNGTRNGIKSVANLARSIFDNVRIENFDEGFKYDNNAGSRLTLSKVGAYDCRKGFIFNTAGGHYIEMPKGDNITEEFIEINVDGCTIINPSIEQNDVMTTYIYKIVGNRNKIYGLSTPRPASGNRGQNAGLYIDGDYNSVSGELRDCNIELTAASQMNDCDIRFDGSSSDAPEYPVIGNENNIVKWTELDGLAGNPVLSHIYGQRQNNSYVKNGYFTAWSSGVTSAPDYWSNLSGTVAQSTAIYDVTNMQVTTTSGGNGYIEIDLSQFIPVDYFQHKKTVFTILLKAEASGNGKTVRAQPIGTGVLGSDGIITASSSTIKRLSCIAYTDNTASNLKIRLLIENASGTAAVNFFGAAAFIGEISDDALNEIDA